MQTEEARKELQTQNESLQAEIAKIKSHKSKLTKDLNELKSSHAVPQPKPLEMTKLSVEDLEPQLNSTV